MIFFLRNIWLLAENVVTLRPIYNFVVRGGLKKWQQKACTPRGKTRLK
jgi:hypothetical protein